MASKETQEIVDKLTAMEDTFFHKLVEDSAFCEELIQTVTGKKSLRLVEATAQKSLRNIKGRSVVLDAYCIDTENDKLIKLGKLTVEEIAASIPSLSVEEIIELQESVLQIS